MTAASALAQFTVDWPPETLPPAVDDAIRRYLLDLAGVAAAGAVTLTARQAREAAVDLFGAGDARLWFDGRRVHPKAAVLANAAASSVLDLDDGHRGAVGHPGAGIIPAVLALAGSRSWSDISTAIAVGYEVALRVGAGRPAIPLAAVPTGRWVGVGVAAAAARLAGLNGEQTAHALAIAAFQAPDLSAFAYSRATGNSVKEGIGWAAVTGLAAVDLARFGHTGPLDIFDHLPHYDAERIVGSLGAVWVAKDAYLKRYSCCRWIHPLIDGLYRLRAENGFRPEEVRAIEVETFGHAVGLANALDPDTIEAAQYSIPYCLALACELPAELFLPLTAADLHRASAVRLGSLVRMVAVDEFERPFPARAGGRIRISLADRELEATVVHPVGDPGNPMTDRQLADKLAHLAASGGRPDLPERMQLLFGLPAEGLGAEIQNALAVPPLSQIHDPDIARMGLATG